jgi:hypothetical protein
MIRHDNANVTEATMNDRALLRALTSIATIAVALLAAAPLGAQNSVRMEDPASGTGVIWWVVGAGGALGADGDRGEVLSATVGQAAIDRASEPGQAAYYGYWLPSHNATSSVELDNAGVVYANALAVRVAPNPFVTMTTISYSLPARAHVFVRVFDLVGNPVRTLADETREAGTQSVQWDGRDDRGEPASSGAYLYTIETGSHDATVASAHGIVNLVK